MKNYRSKVREGMVSSIKWTVYVLLTKLTMFRSSAHNKNACLKACWWVKGGYQREGSSSALLHHNKQASNHSLLFWIQEYTVCTVQKNSV